MVEVHLLTAMIVGGPLRYSVMFRIKGPEVLAIPSDQEVELSGIMVPYRMGDGVFTAESKDSRTPLSKTVSEVVGLFKATKVSFNENWSWSRYAENMRTMVHMEKLVKASRLGDLMVIGSLLGDDTDVTDNIVWYNNDMCVRRKNLFSYVWIEYGVVCAVRRLTSCNVGRQSWDLAVMRILREVYEDTSEWWVDSTVG